VGNDKDYKSALRQITNLRYAGDLQPPGAKNEAATQVRGGFIF